MVCIAKVLAWRLEWLESFGRHDLSVFFERDAGEFANANVDQRRWRNREPTR